MSNINIPKTIIACWIIIAILYCIRVPYDELSNDLGGHLEYTKIIVKNHRLPAPNEGMETFQFPLYYLINSFISPSSFSNNTLTHVHLVRALSVLYGAISLLIINWFLKQGNQNPVTRLIVLLFIATTPAFVFVFTTYNNDSLLNVFAIAMIAIFYKLSKEWSTKHAFILAIIATAAIYTKLIAFYPILVLIIVCIIKIIRKNLAINHLKISLILLISLLLTIPYLLYCKKKYHVIALNPPQVHEQYNTKINLKQIKNLIGIVFRIPRLQTHKVDYSHEWNDPWQHSRWDVIHPATKRYDYFSNALAVSIVGEGIFTKPNISFVWIILWIHLLAYMFGIKDAFKSNFTKLNVLMILLTHILQIASIPLYPELPHRAMGYRYIMWSCMNWASLYMNTLSNNSKLSSLLNTIFIFGIVVQVYILLTLNGYLIGGEQ